MSLFLQQTQLQKAKIVAPAAFLAKKLAPELRDLRRYQICGKTG